MDNEPTPDASQSTEGRILKYVVIVIGAPAGGVINMNARGELRQIKADLEEAHRERVSFDGVNPLNELCGFSIPVNQLDNIVTVFEQIVVLTNDPRKAGLQSTPSGIVLPGA